MIEKMKMMNLVAHIEDVDSILKDIVLLNNVHIVNAKHEIDESNFTICMLEENAEEIADMCVIKSYNEKRKFRDVEEKLEAMTKFMDIKDSGSYMDLKEHLRTYEDMAKIVDDMYEDFSSNHDRVKKLELEKDKLEKFSIVRLLGKAQIDLKAANEMEFFTLKLGTLLPNERAKLAKNYENITAAVMHIGKLKDREAFLIVSPRELGKETDRILRSVHFEEIPILEEYIDYPQRMVRHIESRLKEIDKEIKTFTTIDDSHITKYKEEVIRCNRQLELEKVISGLKKNIAMTGSFAYVSGWISEKSEKIIEDKFAYFGHQIILAFKDVEDVTSKIITPTKLKNNRFFKPFEELIQMYGTPSYTELDPTIFFGFAYMLLFGAMFGDLGQGLLLVLAGMVMGKKMKNSNFGGILSRLGLSSMTFGFFYDSFFGYEHVISAVVKLNIFMRPIENINPVLMASIGIGIFFLTISFSYSIFNKLKRREFSEGFFGRNGINGLVLFLVLILIVIDISGIATIIPTTILFPLVGVSIVLLVFREPLTNLILGIRPLHHEPLSEYYVESGFNILETFLSILSNSVSFIRVGAFALNHVGLFIAFHTIADIIGNTAGNISMFILGNLLVIFLEGLVVFIQGLRLVYYEMFSKYYTGDGIEFIAEGSRGI